VPLSMKNRMRSRDSDMKPGGDGSLEGLSEAVRRANIWHSFLALGVGSVESMGSRRVA